MSPSKWPKFGPVTLNSRLETYSLLLPKIIEYVVFQLSLSHWFMFIETL